MEIYEVLTGFSNGTGGRKSEFWVDVNEAKKAAQRTIRKFTKENGHKFTGLKAAELKDKWLFAWASDTTKKFFGIRKVEVNESGTNENSTEGERA